MTGDRWAVLGLARPRAPWFSSLAQWATSGSVPIDFVKCVSAAEVRARLRGGRTFSALLIGGDSPGIDRDLIDVASSVGTVAIVVGPSADRDWDELGIVARLVATFERSDLLAALGHHATPIAGLESPFDGSTIETDAGWRGRLVAVTGPGGAGSSLAAMALAQALASEPSNRALVLLADLALHGDQAMLHDAREVVPGVEELVEAHRSNRLTIAEVRALAFEVVGRDYHLLLGLRRHHDWTALRSRAFEAALDGALRSYRLIVADLDPEVEGQAETGSLDIEDRNLMARSTTRQADIIVVVGRSGTKGLHSLTGVIRDLVGFGLDAGRIVPTITCASRSRRRRAEATAALARLLDDDDMSELGNPVFVPERTDVEDSLRDGVRLPSVLGRTLRSEVTRRLAEPSSTRDRPSSREPAPVRPGTLGTWAEEAG